MINKLGEKHMNYNQIPQAEIKDPPLRIEIDNLEKMVMFLTEQLQVLEGRLCSVLSDAPPETGCLARDTHGNSAMTRKVYEITNEIRFLSGRVGNLIDRLEL